MSATARACSAMVSWTLLSLSPISVCRCGRSSGLVADVGTAPRQMGWILEASPETFFINNSSALSIWLKHVWISGAGLMAPAPRPSFGVWFWYTFIVFQSLTCAEYPDHGAAVKPAAALTRNL